jgi:hypothetical protein
MINKDISRKYISSVPFLSAVNDVASVPSALVEIHSKLTAATQHLNTKDHSVDGYTIHQNLQRQRRPMSEEENTADKDHPDNKKLSSEGWSNLRERKRHCTDCLCLVELPPAPPSPPSITPDSSC